MFVAKKLFSLLVLPLSLSLLLLCMALLLWRRRVLSAILVMLPLFILTFIASTPGSLALIQPLEQQYQVNNTPITSPCVVVVLGSGHNDQLIAPATIQLSNVALSRLTEGIRQRQLGHDCQLVVSGWPGFGNRRPHADVMAEAAIMLGVPSERIIRLPDAKDTMEEAKGLQQLGMAGHIRLVTSATHMPRAMHIYQQHGFTPSAAPTDFIADHDAWWRLDGHKLNNSQRAVHEYVGQLWLELQHWWYEIKAP